MNFFTSLLNAADRATVTEDNMEKIDRSLAFMLTPSLDLSDMPTVDLGPPDAGAHVQDELWVDALRDLALHGRRHARHVDSGRAGRDPRRICRRMRPTNTSCSSPTRRGSGNTGTTAAEFGWRCELWALAEHDRTGRSLQMWAVVVKSLRTEWIHWCTIDLTRRAAWAKYKEIWMRSPAAVERDLNPEGCGWQNLTVAEA
jgi:hypothetical protein